jgi:adenylosuccinate synthase
LLAAQAKLVARYAGGGNAGHTVIVGTETYKLHLVPSGILYPDVACVIGSGCVIDPAKLLAEIDDLRARGIDTGRLFVAAGAHVTMPYHRLLDGVEERRRGAGAIGTTGLGIGPTYTDKANRSGLRIGDLLDPARFRTRLAELLELKNLILERIYGLDPLDFEAVATEYLAHGERLRPYVANTAALVDAAVRRGDPVLFEGAQGPLLDIDQGTYPYVTSSHPIAGGACVGTGIGPTAIDRAIGVTKAYTTRVGSGPFPTELHDAIGDRLRAVGQEFGTTTGRARRCGWFDAVVGRLAVRANGLDGLAVTKLDVLDGLPELQICVAYELNGDRITEFPSTDWELAACTPIYETVAGWAEPCAGARTLAELPAEARAYLRRLEDLLGVPVVLAAVGPERDQTIVVEDLLAGPRRVLAR